MKRENKKGANFVIMLTAALLIVSVVAVALILTNLVSSFKDNITEESANHLVEINYQVKLYIEKIIENSWLAIQSSVNSAAQIEFKNDDDILRFIKSEREIWNISDIIIYTADGHSMTASGRTVYNDDASETVYNAKKNGRYLAVSQSMLTYTMPLDSEMSISGSPVVAYSFVRDIEDFIDNMEFTSFGGNAYLYLTQENGIIISQLTHPDAISAHNIQSIMDGYEVSKDFSDEHGTIDDILISDSVDVHLLERDGELSFAVSAPVDTSADTGFRLFYFVPESAVNMTMNSFSSYVVRTSVAIIAVFGLLAVFIFLYIFISRSKQFDKALSARDRMFNLLVTNTMNAFSLLSVNEETPIYVSSNTESVVGVRFLGLRKTANGFMITVPADESADFLSDINTDLSVWDGKERFSSKYTSYTNGDRKYNFSLHIYPIEKNRDEFVVIAQDITKEHEREEALKVAMLMANTANTAKTRFLANMSHDIRTPMNAIVNITDFAIESIGKPEEQRGYLQTIRESSAHLLHLINDVLDMSKIESGETFIASEPFDLSECLRECSDVISPLCKEKELTFDTDFTGIHSKDLIGDKLKLAQILINLLNNAVKFTPEGGRIAFAATDVMSIRSETAALRFVVSDSGLGISESDIEKIFDPFMRADNDPTKKIEGTGLGLSICKSYISAMGGNITCDSAPGRGSTFTVELSFPKVEPETKPDMNIDPTAHIDFCGLRALVCEDNAVNSLIAVKILEKLGFKVQTAENGKEGAEKFIASGKGYFNIIYMDIQMPVMDGYHAALMIRESGHPQAKTVPIIAMTANVFAEDIEKSRTAGMNGHIAKPIIINDLIKATNKALKTRGAE